MGNNQHPAVLADPHHLCPFRDFHIVYQGTHLFSFRYWQGNSFMDQDCCLHRSSHTGLFFDFTFLCDTFRTTGIFSGIH